MSFKIETKVEEILSEEPTDNQNYNVPQNGNIIRVFVTRKGQSQPVLAATINMPPTELPFAV